IEGGPEEATFRDATRLGQFLSAGGAQDSGALAKMLAYFDQSAMVRLCNAKLTQLVREPLAPLVNQARSALFNRDTSSLHATARGLRKQTSRNESIEADVAACLVATSDIIDRRHSAGFSQGAG